MKNKGFSLVELSIVLVILGLLTGGILGGQSLIRAAELRAVSTEYQRYKTAAATFRDKYFALPGDMTNAVSFWPTATNGNGNGAFETAGAASGVGEVWGFWQQLSLAALIEGTYTGAAGSAGAFQAVIGTNAPRSRLNNGGWSAYTALSPTTQTALPASTGYFEGTYGNVLLIGAAAGIETIAPLFVPSEIWNIDTKMDDGKPSTGFIRVFESSGGSTAGQRCYTGVASTSALTGTVDYDLAATGVYCAGIMQLGM
jgi:prepilin-type N-terminal cleavage/methylation domain-containing protein